MAHATRTSGSSARASALEELGEPDAAPDHVADSACRDVGLDWIAEAFEHRRHVGRRQRRQGVIVELEGALDEAVDAEAPLSGIHPRDAHMGDDVDVVGRREARRELIDRHEAAKRLLRIHQHARLAHRERRL
jgi:hypothetical protein